MFKSMSEKFPYDEGADHQFDDLPVPDQEQSWQKMQELLNKEDGNKRVPPPFYFRSCFGLGVIAALLAVTAFFIFRPDKSLLDDGTDKTSSVQKQSTSIDRNINTAERNNPAQSKPLRRADNSADNDPSVSSDQHTITKINQAETFNSKEVSAERTEPTQKKSNRNSNTKKPAPDNESNGISNEKESNQSLPPSTDVVSITSQGNKVIDEENNDVKISEANRQDKENEKVVDAADPVDLKNRKTRNKDSADNTIDTMQKKKLASGLFWSAGIGIQQQIALAGQDPVPYDFYGRKNSISDYIPSVFLRLHKPDKWFIMGEFRYGAPQALSDFNYSRRTSFDTGSQVITTTSMRLLKTYYHQLPISFNYYVKPGWSVGAGAMYSRFSGAVTETETKNTNIQTQQETIVKRVSNIQGFKDSFLYKTQVHLMLQTDYQWKNFLVGLRYTKDVQPYIKYTNPDGTIRSEKNFTLQAIIRWQFWSSEN